jgi:hypothetical protein
VLKQRLALAAYKAQNGLSAVAFEQIEPRVEEQARKRKARQSQDLQPPNSKRQAVSKVADRSHTPGLEGHHPFPPSMSLYDAMMTPNLNSVYGSFSPRLGEAYAETAGPANHPSPPRLKTIIHTDPVTGLQHPSSPISSAREETPFNRPDSPIGRSPTLKHKRTGSLPAHAFGSNPPKGLVQAASALANLTRGPSEEPIPAKAFDRVTPPPPSHPPSSEVKKSPRSTSAPAFGGIRQRSKSGAGEDQRETAAELMLYLASSPSPQQKKTMEALPNGDSPMMKGRKLFAEEEDGLQRAAGGHASQPFLAPQHLPPASIQSQPSQMHPLQPQKMPQLPLPVSSPQSSQRPMSQREQQEQQHMMNAMASAQHAQQMADAQQMHQNGLPPFSTAESYATHAHAHSAPLYYSHPANLQPSFTMQSLQGPAAYPMSYSMPSSAPPPDLLKGEALYFAQSAGPHHMQQTRNAPPPFDVSMYMNAGPQGGAPYQQIPHQYQQFGQTW